MKKTAIVAMTVSAVLLAAVPAAGGVDEGIGFPATEAQVELDRGWSDLDDVRAATGQYHELPSAINDGFVPFALDGSDTPTCFESETGGMGVHYVRNVDDVVDHRDPEAMVYELTETGQPRLVAVEYVVPEEFVEDADGDVVALPSLHGQDFHKHATLPLYILHVWLWEENPDGLFADFNPTLAACPAVV